jgi:hypothetical protein
MALCVKGEKIKRRCRCFKSDAQMFNLVDPSVLAEVLELVLLDVVVQFLYQSFF